MPSISRTRQSRIHQNHHSKAFVEELSTALQRRHIIVIDSTKKLYNGLWYPSESSGEYHAVGIFETGSMHDHDRSSLLLLPFRVTPADYPICPTR